MSAKLIEGVLPVLATPFTSDGAIDYVQLGDEIDWVLDQGAHGVVMGMVSEALRLSSEERDQLAAAICQKVAGRATVTTSVGGESLHTALRHARHAQAVGVDAVMAIPPISTAASDNELRAYYATLIESIEIPVVVQDASGYLGRPLSIDLQADLHASYGNRAHFKPEAQPIGPRLSALRDATSGKAHIYEGTGGLALVDSFSRGITGTMPGPDLVWALVALWNALDVGNTLRVNSIHGPLSALVSLQTELDAFVAVQKHLLNRQGVITTIHAREPVGFHLDDETRIEVDRLFDQIFTAVKG